jgi:hypothetical protein
LWTPSKNNDYQVAFESLKEFQKMFPELSSHSLCFADTIPLFISRELDNYQLMQTFPGSQAASFLPAEISKLLRLHKKDIRYLGAYPPLP